MSKDADFISLKAKMDKDEELQPVLARMYEEGTLEQALMSVKDADSSGKKSPDALEKAAKEADDEEAETDESGGFVIHSIKDLKAAYEMICKEERVGNKKAKSK